MIDFYEELNLDENDSADDILDALDRLEVLWQRRMTSNLEAAQKKLDLIEKAQTVFKSDASKKEYDKSLYEFKHPKQDNGDAKRKEEFEKQVEMAKDFFERQEYDLAQAAVSNAVNLAPDDASSADLFVFAAEIYSANGDTNSALNNLNKAILLDNTNAKYYYYKAKFFLSIGNIDEYLSLLNTTGEYALKNNDNEYLALSYDDLAEAYYYNIPNCEEKGYEYAKKAVEVNPSVMHSPKIIAEVQKRIEDFEKQQEYEEECRKNYDALYALYSDARSKKDYKEVVDLFKELLPLNYPDPQNIYKGSLMHIRKMKLRKSLFSKLISLILIISIILVSVIFVLPWTKTKKAQEMVDAGQYDQAFIYADKNQRSYKDYSLFDVGISRRKLIEMLKEKEQIKHSFSINTGCVYLIYTDGTVKFVGNPHDTFFADVSKWTNIDNVYCSITHIVGLKNDGTVVAAYNENCDKSYQLGQCNVSKWNNIKKIATTQRTTIGLREDGTVVATGDNSNGQCNVSSWTNIKNIYATENRTVGLREDGTVVATKYKYKESDIESFINHGASDVSDWNDIVDIVLANDQTIGLKSDGTVVATKYINKDRVHQDIVTSSWEGVISICTNGSVAVGLKPNGTILASGEEGKTKTDVQEWKNIVSVKALGNEFVGLEADGTIVATGSKKKLTILNFFKEDFNVPEVMRNKVEFETKYETETE